MNKLKLIISIFFLIVGLIAAYLTYNLSNIDSFGKIKIKTPNQLLDDNSSAASGSGVDSSNDGVAVGLGIISGFSFLSSALLLTSIREIKEKE